MRAYVRCSDCLAVGAVEVEAKHGAPDLPQGLACECGGKVRLMGVVKKNRAGLDRLLYGVREETPCDQRCTHARGPSCDCPCGGANHGTGVVYQIELTTGVPRIRMADPARAEEFRQACEAARERYRLKFGFSLAGEDRPKWLSDEAYMHERRYFLARKGKTHKGRLARLAEVAA